ncbi:MAG: hypothetical protein ACOX46_11965 [Limnochordia bacterium]|nr:hypothetical protein [Limnochordia bacterium]MDI9438360.1 hypothetical protein [Bacillota bacterium]
MKVASGILSLVLSLVIFLQSCTVSMGGAILAEEGTQQGGAVGLLVAFLFLVGGAFAFGVPKVSLVVMALAGLLGMAAGATTPYKDLTIWGGVALALAVLNLFAGRKRKDSPSQT